MKNLQQIPPALFILAATIFEVCGDALVRQSIYKYTDATRLGIALAGAVLLFMYGFSLNLAPVEFGQVVGLYIATLFIVWQVINYFAFGAVPTLPILVGGVFIVTGGLIVNYWK